jgi:hypothetical protein
MHSRKNAISHDPGGKLILISDSVLLFYKRHSDGNHIKQRKSRPRLSVERGWSGANEQAQCTACSTQQ